MMGWDDDGGSDYAPPPYWQSNDIKEKITEAKSLIAKHPWWYNYPPNSKDKKAIDKAYQTIKEQQEKCTHRFEIEVLFQLPIKKCTVCGKEDETYDHTKG
jgi:hypothetical protein